MQHRPTSATLRQHEFKRRASPTRERLPDHVHRAVLLTKAGFESGDLEAERLRFNRRLQLIKGTPIAKELKVFRRSLMRRYTESDSSYVVKSDRRGRAVHYNHHADEYLRLHQFLDRKEVAPCE